MDLRNEGGLINRLAGVKGWHMVGTSGSELGESGSVRVAPSMPSVERERSYQAAGMGWTVARPRCGMLL